MAGTRLKNQQQEPTTTRHNIGIELMKAAGDENPTAGTLDKPLPQHTHTYTHTHTHMPKGYSNKVDICVCISIHLAGVPLLALLVAPSTCLHVRQFTMAAGILTV